MTVSENEEAIYKQLNKNRLRLYATLSKKINVDTDDYFYINDGVNIYYPDLENLDEFTFWNPNPQHQCPCPQFRNEGNGVVSFLGAVFKEGWENTEQWEMVADIKFGLLQKTGLILITDANNPFPKSGWYSEASGRWGISAWERFIGTPYTLDEDPHYEITYEGDSERFTSYSSSWVNNIWHSLHVKKVSSTRLIVWLDDNENDKIIYDWEELSDVERVTFGATMNHNTYDYGGSSCNDISRRLYIRDLFVFYPSLPTNKLTALCEDTKKILSNVNNLATIPETYSPEEIPTTLAQKELDIHNRIQYCNNVLRYTLRKNGIDFQNSNIMQELIKYIGDIESSRRKIYFYLYDGDTSTPAGDLNIGCVPLSSNPEGNVEISMRWDSENSRYVGEYEVSKTFYESEDWTFNGIIPSIKKSNHHVTSDAIQLTDTQTDVNGYKLAEIGIIQNKEIIIPVSINWDDNSNSRGLRPASVTVYYQSQSISTVLSNTNSYEANLFIPEIISFDKNNLTSNSFTGYSLTEITENINAAQIAEYILTYTFRSASTPPTSEPS